MNFARRATLGAMAFAAVSGIALGQANQNFTLVNHTGFTVVTLNISAAGEARWGPDILGTEVLASGESAEITFEATEQTCLWDLRVTYDDGDDGEWRGTDLCETSTVTLE
jgi:hypothetical protein